MEEGGQHTAAQDAPPSLVDPQSSPGEAPTLPVGSPPPSQRVDAHLHVWRAAAAGDSQVATIVPPSIDVPIELVAAYLDEHGVDRAVLVQPVFPGEDNSYVAECARNQPHRFAAVCVVDPTQPGAEGRLAYWVEERGCRGLRLRPRFPREAALFGDPSTFALWRTASRTQTVVSVLAAPEHLPALAELLERFPGVDVIVDHLGHPDLAAGRGRPALLALLKLAMFPRLFVKLSGFYHFTKEHYPYSDCIDSVRILYDRFGAQRLIWGSDFPHVVLTMSYPRSLHWLERECSFIPPAERELILGRNALKLYWPSIA